MTYTYLDGKGKHAGHGPSIGGAMALHKVVKAAGQTGLYPQLNQLLATGTCMNTEQLKGEALRLLSKVTDRDVKDSLRRLAIAASKAEDGIMLTS
jgi:hypothetical protein